MCPTRHSLSLISVLGHLTTVSQSPWSFLFSTCWLTQQLAPPVTEAHKSENGAWALTPSAPLLPTSVSLQVRVDLLPKRSLNLPTGFPSPGPSRSRLLTEPCCSPLLTVLSAFSSLLFKLFFPLEPEQPVRSPNLMESLPHLKAFNGFCWLLDRVQASTTWQRQYSPNTPRTPPASSANVNTGGVTSLVQASGLWVGVTRVILSAGTCS